VKTRTAFATAALLAFAAVANAHTRLKVSVPAEGSVITVSPANIVLTFSGPTRLTALTVRKEGEAEQKVSPLPAELAAQVTVPSPKLAPGKYIVSWRVVGADSHVMAGTLHFSVDPAATPTAGKAPAQHQRH